MYKNCWTENTAYFSANTHVVCNANRPSMNRPTFFISLIFYLFGFYACGQKKTITPIVPTEFIETVQPKSGSEEWLPLNHSQNEFRVENIEGQLKITKITEGSNIELKVTDGTLIGINRGEFGGLLKFVPSDTTLKEIEIKKGNVEFIFFYKDKIYFIEGLAHMGFSGGALYKLEIKSNNFKYDKILDFEDAPEAFTIYKDKFLVAAYESFYIVEDFKKEIILKETFWGGLYPNSIATFDDKNVFIGLKSGIVKLDLTTKMTKFYKYAK